MVTQLLLSLLLSFFAGWQLPSRMGRMRALATLSPPESFHFMIAYAASDGSRVARSLASVLSQSGASVWLDAYRMENAFPLRQAVLHAAREAAFQVLVVTPEFVPSVECCMCLVAALRRPAAQVLVWIDGSAPSWGSGQLARVEEWLRGRGFRVVTTRLETLVRALDGVLMSQEDHHADWWRRQAVGQDLRLRDVMHRVRDIDCRPRQRLSLRGRLVVPRGAVSSGLHMLSADGRSFSRILRLPLKLVLSCLSVLGTISICVYDLLYSSDDWARLYWLTAPYWLYYLVVALRDADVRLAHTPLLLNTLLVSKELNAASGVAVAFVGVHQSTKPTRDFLTALGISSTSHTIDELQPSLDSTVRLPSGTLHVFVLETDDDAAAYLRRFAGRQCELQLLVLSPALTNLATGAHARALATFASVPLDDGFAHKFFEVFGNKLVNLIRTQRAL